MTGAPAGSARAFPLSSGAVDAIVRAALEEDRAFDDVTTLATVDARSRARARLASRSGGVMAGLPLAIAAFRLLDPAASVHVEHPDGSAVDRGVTVLEIAGSARALLSAERVALNFAQRLSGIATLASRFVAAVAGTRARIYDTRKTTPGWRALEKYAVRCGGGVNHRADLTAAVLIKDNHLAAVGGDIAVAIARSRAAAPAGTTVEVECDDAAQVRAALDAGADVILLDNMTLDGLRACVKIVGGRVPVEASGGISLERVRAIAETGVDRISVGALTHSAPALDLGLDFVD